MCLCAAGRDIAIIDALLFAWRDAIRTLSGYKDAAHCEIVADSEGRPPARMGNWFAAVHQGSYRSTMDNALDEYYGVNVTLTMRLDVPVDRAGDQFLAKQLAAQPGPGGSPSFNWRMSQLRAFLHMNWGAMQDANNNLMTLTPDTEIAYGFSEPARFRGMDEPQFVGGDWFGSEPTEVEAPLGLKATLRFEDCRRGPQAIGAYS